MMHLALLIAAYASTAGIAKFFLPVQAFYEKGDRDAGQCLGKPQKTFCSNIRWSKSWDKIGVIKNLLDKVDTLLIGGGVWLIHF